jgi:hypothetical protein
MNERIKQLAEQARQHFPRTESSGEFWVFDEQKFAELIVKECVGIADEYDGVGSTIVSRIEKHFGVEE